MDPIEEDFLTQSFDGEELIEDDYQQPPSFKFPPGVDLGTSYGSYLLSRGKSTRRKVTHKKGPTTIPKLPTIVPSVHQDIALLLSSLNELCSRLRANGYQSAAMETCLADLHNLDHALSLTPGVNKGQLVLLFLQQLTQVIVSLTPEIGRGLSPSISGQKEIKAFRRLYQTTEAELVATRNYCQKLQHKLETVFEQAELKQSQLACELLATKKMLAEANFELQKEKTKAQSAYLLSNQSQRELGKYKKVLSGTNFEKQVQENAQLKAKLEEKTKIEEQLRKRWHEDRLKLTQLTKQVIKKSSAAPITQTKREKFLPEISKTNTRKVTHQKNYSRKQLQAFNIYGQARKIESHGHSRQPIVPLASKWDELMNLARFPNEKVAKETKEILNKQGLLYN